MTNSLLVAILLCLLTSASALDPNQIGVFEGQNCTYYYYASSNSSELPQCQPWSVPSVNNSCIGGNGIHDIVNFAAGTSQTFLPPFYCMTTSVNLTDRRDVLGGCLYSSGIPHEAKYFPLPCNISLLNWYMCAGLNRDGQLCGRCKEGFAPQACSYALNCVNCANYSHINILQYVAIAYGPLTVFCAVIILFHISAMSPYLHGYILFCQLLSLPYIIRITMIDHNYARYKSERDYINIYISLLGIWNLDFFRLVYEPFCLHPNLTIVQSLALDYLVAVYPLALVVITLILVSLYQNNCKVVVCLWKSLRWCIRPVFLDLDIRASLIESFSTLYLLSVIKIQSVSIDLLLPTTLYYVDGSHSEHYYLYLAGDVQYFGDSHILYGLLALIMYITFVLFPTLLLIVYPCKCFQQFLNKTNCNSHLLRTYMDVFQGHYKDGTDGSRDYRFFPGMFLAVRTLAMCQFVLMGSFLSYITIGLLVTFLGVTVAVFHPQKSNVQYILDCIFLSSLVTLVFVAIGNVLITQSVISNILLRYITIATVALPHVYLTGLILYWTIREKKIPQWILGQIHRNIIAGTVNVIKKERHSKLLCSFHQ